MRFLWPLMFGKEVVNYLGYTYLKFTPEIYVGNASGWELKVEPSATGETTRGYSHKVTLYAQVDQFAADYNVVARIKCTRILSNGEEYGSTYIYVPLKAAAYNYVYMRPVTAKKSVSPKSIASFELEVTNRGFYEDVFKFKAYGENGINGVFSQSAVLLKPGETKTIVLNVLTPDVLFDPGTPINIKIYVTSIKAPEETYVGSVIVENYGFHFSQLSIMGIVVAVIVVVILAYILKKLVPIYSKKEKSKEEKKR